MIPYRKLRTNKSGVTRAFFELGKDRARAAGWYRSDGTPKGSIPLGPAGPEADSEALRLYDAYLTAIGEKTPSPALPHGQQYPPGSLGRFFENYKRSDAWAWKKPRTRDDYDRVWPVIAGVHASTRVDRISAAMSESFHVRVHKMEGTGEISGSERFRILKIWRALLNALAKHGIIDKAPIGSIPNPKPQGRKQNWFASEIVKLVKTANDTGYPGMALAIWISWETLLSPVDVRGLSLSMRRKDAHGAYFHLREGRQKTGKEVYAAISEKLDRAIDAYVKGLGCDLTPSAPFIRQRNGSGYRGKDTFGDDFRAVRAKAFPKDARQLMDIRRSGNLEADLGGASAEDRGTILANGLANDRHLEETYTPPTVAKAREIAKNRSAGRAILKAMKAGQSVNGPA